VNLFTEPLYTSVFVQAFFSDMVSRVKPLTPDAWPFGPKAADMVYNVRTQHAALFGDAHASYVMSKEEVLVEMGKFIINWRLEAQRSAKGALPRLCVSNIAWADEHEAQVVQVFRQRGVLNVEVAPTRVRSEWKDITAEALDAFGARMRSLGLGIYSFQAVIYNQPDLHLFKDDASREALVQHMRRVIDMLRQLAGDADSGRRIVFGAPKNRLLHGKTAEEATEIAVRVFRELGDYASLNGVCVCLEANPKQYACEFITSAVEAAELVRKVNSPGFMLHLDTACMHLAGDDFRAIIAKNVDILRHVHVSEPNLGNFSAPQCSHAEVCRALLEAKYPYSVCIEMRPSGADSVANVDQAIEFVARAYAPLLAAKP
jgi:sugar phosphate isomerase/epimerase